MKIKKWPLAPIEAQSLHAKYKAARDMMIEVAEWAVRHYSDKRTRKAVADVWRHFGETWVRIEDYLVDNGAEQPTTAIVLGHSMRHLPKRMLPTPTIEEHLSMSEKLWSARANMADIFCRLARAMAISARPVKTGERSYKLLGRLRSSLDDRVRGEHPHEQLICYVYYGGNADRDKVRARFGMTKQVPS